MAGKFDPELKSGYALYMVDMDDAPGCNAGGTSTWALDKNGKTVAAFTSCHCGRECGNKAVVVCDFLGSHDLEPEIEAVRAD